MLKEQEGDAGPPVSNGKKESYTDSEADGIDNGGENGALEHT